MNNTPKQSIRVSMARVRRKTILVLHAKAFELNETADFIWRKCDGNLTIESIVADLACEYEIEIEDAFKDVNALILDWRELGLLA
jgi:pyrroloquinoline quinone biosynthesis protein D